MTKKEPTRGEMIETLLIEFEQCHVEDDVSIQEYSTDLESMTHDKLVEHYRNEHDGNRDDEFND